MNLLIEKLQLSADRMLQTEGDAASPVTEMETVASLVANQTADGWFVDKEAVEVAD